METAETKKLGHVMVDLETMGRDSDAVICSIGAVEFDINTGELGREYFTKVDIQSGLDRGLTVNGPTIEWWLMQSEKARMAVVEGNGINISQMLYEFKQFIEKLGSETVQIWGNGATFDITILTESYRHCNLKEPWNFRCERDVRTLVSFAPYVKEHFPKMGTEHHPVDDCKYQIGYCAYIWQKLNINTDKL
jgi:exodeoxyribonuclease VIII